MAEAGEKKSTTKKPVAPKLSTEEFYQKQLEDEKTKYKQLEAYAKQLEAENVNLINGYHESATRVETALINIQSTIGLVLPDIQRVNQNLVSVKQQKMKQQQAVNKKA